MTTTDHRTAERQVPDPVVLQFRVDPHPSPASVEVRQGVVERPEFGRYFTDHMAPVDWTADGGWHDPRVVPLAQFSLHPAAAVLHYGQEIFEGLKVYRHPDGHLRVVRPDERPPDAAICTAPGASMNIFFVLDGTVITPPADGTILEGVTCASILELAVDLVHPTEVRPFSIHEWIDAAASGGLSEVFASGTAAVVTPIRELVADTQTITTPTPGLGPIAAGLRHELTGIQFGTIPDRFGWMQPVGEPR